MKTSEVIGIVNHLQQILMVYKEITSLPNCNDCVRGDCDIKPKAGSMVRFNCHKHIKLDKEPDYVMGDKEFYCS